MSRVTKMNWMIQRSSRRMKEQEFEREEEGPDL
jgi:hypothetical protein